MQLKVEKCLKKPPEITDGLQDVRAQILGISTDIEGSNFPSHPV